MLDKKIKMRYKFQRENYFFYPVHDKTDLSVVNEHMVPFKTSSESFTDLFPNGKPTPGTIGAGTGTGTGTARGTLKKINFETVHHNIYISILPPRPPNPRPPNPRPPNPRPPNPKRGPKRPNQIINNDNITRKIILI